ncbi:hypothetical protein Taro_050680 [Colocasia esculenta]|uniref:Uncharacterized protein n=1 Tax=Colocasia esculenta TaxID=4460 RepID=A0A843XE14_COLES|nr:hypothetical protein [Colocasia esculenta]
MRRHHLHQTWPLPPLPSARSWSSPPGATTTRRRRAVATRRSNSNNAEAFRPFLGSLMGSWKYLNGVINNAAYPLLCADYLSRIFSRFSGGAPREVAFAGFNLALSFLNYTRLSVVGWAAVALGAVSLASFAVMAATTVQKVRPGRWLGRGETGAGRGRTRR